MVASKLYAQIMGEGIRSAGKGGFEWRDRVIAQELKKEKKWWGPLIASWGLQIILAVVVAAVVIPQGVLPTVSLLLFAGALLPRSLSKQVRVFASLAPALLPVIAFGADCWLYSLLMIAAWLLICSDSLRLSYLTTVLFAGLVNTSLSSHTTAAALGALIALVLIVLVAVRTDQINYWLWVLLDPDREMDEPVRFPIFLQKRAKRVIREAGTRKYNSVAIKQIGSQAERVTAVALQELPGSIAYHDITLPGAKVANIDHLVVSPHGVFIIDSKFYNGTIEKRGNDVVKVVASKSESLEPIAKQMRWAQEAVQRLLPENTVTRGIVSVQKASVPEMVVFEKGEGDKVAFLDVRQLVYIIKKFPVTLDPAHAAAVIDSLDSVVGERQPVYAKSERSPLTI